MGYEKKAGDREKNGKPEKKRRVEERSGVGAEKAEAY